MLSEELSDEIIIGQLNMIIRCRNGLLWGRLVFSFNLHTYETQLLSNNIRLGL